MCQTFRGRHSVLPQLAEAAVKGGAAAMMRAEGLDPAAQQHQRQALERLGWAMLQPFTGVLPDEQQAEAEAELAAMVRQIAGAEGQSREGAAEVQELVAAAATAAAPAPAAAAAAAAAAAEPEQSSAGGACSAATPDQVRAELARYQQRQRQQRRELLWQLDRQRSAAEQCAADAAGGEVPLAQLAALPRDHSQHAAARSLVYAVLQHTCCPRQLGRAFDSYSAFCRSCHHLPAPFRVPSRHNPAYPGGRYLWSSAICSKNAELAQLAAEMHERSLYHGTSPHGTAWPAFY